MKKKQILILFAVFLFSISVRLWNINRAGRNWDELFYTEQGYKMFNLAKKGDFSNFFWIKDPDEPVLAKYFYGLAAGFDVKSFTQKGEPIFHYDLFYTRLVSVLFGVLTAVVVALIGLIYFSSFIAITAGVIFSLIPTVLGLNQLVTIESILMFFFTASIFVFLRFLEYPSGKKSYLFGTLLGLSFIIKYSDVLLVPLCLFIYCIWHFNNKKNKKINHFTKSNILLFLLGMLNFVFVWPMPWFHLGYMIPFEYSFRFAKQSSPWEWFFGFPIHVPWIYYFVHFLIRTPFLLLVLSLVGLKAIDVKRKWIYFAVLAWFAFPFVQSFYHFRMQGVRYIVEVYVPFSLIAAIGFDYVTQKISPKLWVKITGLCLITLYLLIILIKISPYYLDYFNILTNGAEGVYKNNLFDIGWWGEGGKEAGEYLISHAAKNSRIGYMLDPFSALELSDDLKYFPFQKGKDYDYVVTNYFEFQKVGYNNPQELANYEILKRDYKLVYTVNADEAALYHVYKNKSIK